MNPVHIADCLFLISFGSICFGGLNASWWRSFISAAFDVMENALYAMYILFIVSVLGGVAL